MNAPFDLSDLGPKEWRGWWDSYNSRGFECDPADSEEARNTLLYHHKEEMAKGIERLKFKFDPLLIKEDIRSRIISCKIPGLIAFSVKPIGAGVEDLSEYLDLFVSKEVFFGHFMKDSLRFIMELK